jgi:predicted XRE-type DNA-binding protein
MVTISVEYKKKHDLTQEEFAEILGIDKSKVSKILRHRIKEFSTDRLIVLYQRLNPRLRIRVV